MCVVLQHPLAKGWLKRRPPVGYPRCLALPGIEPECAPCTVWPLHLQSGPSCPDTLTKAAFAPLGTLDQPCAVWMRANLIAVGLRPGRFPLSPEPHRAGRRLHFSPCAPIDQPSAGWMPPASSRLDCDRGDVRSPRNPSRTGALAAPEARADRRPGRQAVSRGQAVGICNLRLTYIV